MERKTYIATFNIEHFNRQEVAKINGSTIDDIWFEENLNASYYDFLMEELNRKNSEGIKIYTLDEFTAELNDGQNTDPVWIAYFYAEE